MLFPLAAIASPDSRLILSQELAPPCTDASLQALATRWRRSYFPAGAALRNCGTAAVPVLVDILNDPNVSLTIRGLTTRLLARIGTEPAISALLEASQYRALQPALQRSFTVLDAQPDYVVPLLVSALADPSPSRVSMARFALGQIASGDVVLALSEQLATAEGATYNHAMATLIEVVSRNPDLINHPNPDIRIAAIYSLGQRYRDQAHDPIDQDTIEQINSTLEMIIPKLEDSDQDVRSAAVFTLGDMAESIFLQLSDLSQIPESETLLALENQLLGSYEQIYVVLVDQIVILAGEQAIWPNISTLEATGQLPFFLILLAALESGYGEDFYCDFSIGLCSFGGLQSLTGAYSVSTGLRSHFDATRPVICRVNWMGRVVPRCRG